MANFCCTSVTQAVLNDDIDSLRNLMQKRKRLDTQDNLGWTALHVAVKKNSEAMVELIINHPDFPIDCRTFEGCTGLSILAQLKDPNLRIAENLILNGADVNIANTEDITPLHFACKNRNLDFVKILTIHNANINCQDFNNYTPLHYCVENNSKEIIEYLLENNADTSLLELNNLNPLMFTFQFDCCLTDLFIPHTTNLNTVSNDGWTALMFAVNRTDYNLTRSLIQHGADVNIGGKYAPIRLVIRFGDFDLLQLIWSKIDYRCVSKDKKFIKFLCERRKIKDDADFFQLILNTPNVAFNMKNKSGFFAELFFKDKFDNNIDKQIYVDVLKCFLQQGIQLKSHDLEAFIKYFKHCTYSDELFKVILDYAIPDITEHIVLYSIGHNLKLTSLLLQHCLYFDSDHLYEYLFIRVDDLTVLEYFFNYFTPSEQYKVSLYTKASIAMDTDNLNSLFMKCPKVKSLQALSRDAFREKLQDVCEETKDFLDVLEKLELPKHLIDIIRFQTPV